MEANSNFQIQLSNEDAARTMLVERYKSSYGDQVKEKVELLLKLDGYTSRFKWLQSILKESISSLHNIMISGYGAGSEMIVARRFGFQEIHGVEVDPALLDVTKTRLTELQEMYPALYDGVTLPYKDEQFDLLVSGHIIEHTESPKDYLHEVMRVLKTGGFLYIEFPSRYHIIELHTGLLSFEWLPTSLRNLILKSLSSPRSFLSPQIKSKYNSILTTGLKQISRRDIFRWLKEIHVSYKDVAYSIPALGYMRMIIKKQ